MVAALAELHQDIEQPHLAGLTGSIHNVNVLHQNLGIPGKKIIIIIINNNNNNKQTNNNNNKDILLTIPFASLRGQHKS